MEANSNKITYENDNLSFALDGQKGYLLSFISGREFIVPDVNESLFCLQFRNAVGATQCFDSSQAESFTCQRSDKEDKTLFTLQYKNIASDRFFERGISARVYIECSKNSPLTQWRIDVDFNSQPALELLEFVEFPKVTLVNDFKAQGGDLELFWPFSEGCLIDDPGARQHPYKAVEYPSGGWYGLYPGPLQMQYMSVQSSKGGLYLASHDESHGPKEIEFCTVEEGTRLIYKVFTSATRTNYKMPYAMVLGGFDGDWYAAAEIYRDFATCAKLCQIPKLKDNPKVLDWIKESPVVCTYAVRGEGHHAGPTQPNKLYPYKNVLPYLAYYKKEFGTNILNIIMQYEGTAPWSPPYVWPPMGGEDLFKDYVDALHDQGNIAGLYCSGTSWTEFSSTGDGDYDCRDRFKELNLIEDICIGPQGEQSSIVCNGDALRWGYDLCASRKKTLDLLASETKKMIAAGVDYVQLFDQNLGCAPYFCHSADHGHPAGPGPWMVHAMQQLIAGIYQQSGANEKGVLLGCEAAAAEPFMENLPLNDLRFNQVLSYGRWVPAYAFVYHEYVNNFQGNQVETIEFFSTEQGANHLLLRTAYSFSIGDLMTIVLNEEGQIHWAWCTKFSVPAPDQKSIIKLIKNLSAWRKGVAKDFLLYGRMEKPYEILNPRQAQVYRSDGTLMNFDKVLSSRFVNIEGRDVQLFVNWQDNTEQVELGVDTDLKTIIIHSSATGEMRQVSSQALTLSIPPLDSLMIEYVRH